MAREPTDLPHLLRNGHGEPVRLETVVEQVEVDDGEEAIQHTQEFGEERWLLQFVHLEHGAHKRAALDRRMSFKALVSERRWPSS